MPAPRSQPSDKQGLSPYLVVKNAARAIEFYSSAFGAEEQYRLAEPNGKIGHAELLIAGSRVLLADEYPDFGALSPVSVGGTPVSLHLYVDDVDATVARAVNEGATLLREVKDEFFGDRTGMLVDPFGHKWHIATCREQVSPEEMQRRWTSMLEQA
jgi:PhnB protein